MKHLLTAALIATAFASPVKADGEVIRGQQAYQMLLYGNVISSTGMIVATGIMGMEEYVIQYLIVRAPNPVSGGAGVFSCRHTTRGETVDIVCTNQMEE